MLDTHEASGRNRSLTTDHVADQEALLNLGKGIECFLRHDRPRGPSPPTRKGLQYVIMKLILGIFHQPTSRDGIKSYR